jgi:predicted metal-dependent hydrolase
MVDIHRLIRSRRRTLSLIVERDGSLTVRAPLRLPEAEIKRFVDSKGAWIERKQAQAAQAMSVAHRYLEGELFPFLGEDYNLHLVPGLRPALVFKNGFRLNSLRAPDGELLFTRWYRQQARDWIEARVAYYTGLHGFQPGKVRISSARTRWGSCSTRGTLSFTWRLVMAPEPVIDYVVVHELCHLKVLSHSKAFWAHVARILPGYVQMRSWLKMHGESLQL